VAGPTFLNCRTGLRLRSKLHTCFYLLNEPSGQHMDLPILLAKLCIVMIILLVIWNTQSTVDVAAGTVDVAALCMCRW